MQPVNDLRFISSKGSQGLPSLTRDKIGLLEAADFLKNEEKVRLLALLSHKRWLTEIGIRKVQKPDPKIAKLIKGLGLASAPWHYTKKDGTRVFWVEVGANEAVLRYLEENRQRLSVLEAGILYGYPVTAALACADITEHHRKNADKKTPAERCLGGIFSRAFKKRESQYLEVVWEDLRVISPKIIAQAEEDRQT